MKPQEPAKEIEEEPVRSEEFGESVLSRSQAKKVFLG